MSQRAMQSAVNPHAVKSVSLSSMITSLYGNRRLILHLTKREVVGRYKCSIFGLAWSFFNPIFTLAVYTVVFSEIFKSRWTDGGGSESKTQFAVVLFVCMIVIGLISEVLNRAPGLITSNANYVKQLHFSQKCLFHL